MKDSPIEIVVDGNDIEYRGFIIDTQKKAVFYDGHFQDQFKDVETCFKAVNFWNDVDFYGEYSEKKNDK